jgi:site-specific DNA-methyltransferase (adenine-specific)
MSLNPYFKSKDKNFHLLHGDTMKLLPQFEHKFDMVFADPPYFYLIMDFLYRMGK